MLGGFYFSLIISIFVLAKTTNYERGWICIYSN